MIVRFLVNKRKCFAVRSEATAVYQFLEASMINASMAVKSKRNSSAVFFRG